MSIEQNKIIARKWVEAFSGTDSSAFDALIAPNFTDHITPPGVPSNVQGIKMQHDLYHGAFPNIRFTVENVVADENMAAITWSAVGNQTGPLQNFPPTGKSATVYGANVFRVANGKITDHWVYFDQMSLLMQLGLVPGPGGH